MNLPEALEIANQWVERLEPYCHRIEIAGSIRRRKPQPKDIEIVAIPKVRLTKDLFGNEVPDGYLLDDELRNEAFIKNGPKYKQILLNGKKLDLFLVTPPAQWGYIMTIRTGPDEFSKWLVTKKKYGGGMPSYIEPKDGALWNRSKLIPTPEEEDLFNVIGLRWLAPEERELWKSQTR